MLDFSTINELFLFMSQRGSTTVAQWKDHGDWKPISSQAMYGRVRAAVELLRRWGIQRGDRVALVSENRWEWPVVDFAILAIGAVSVPLYQTLTPEQMGYILRDSGSKAFILSGKQQFKKLCEAGEVPTLEHVCIFDEGDFGSNVESFSAALKGAVGLEKPDASFDAMVRETKPEELATIVYTSGTTGDPKGVVLTHKNLADNLRHSTDGLYIGPKDSSISFLPLSHALARHLDYAIYGNGGQIAYLPKFDDLVGAMKAVRPTIFLAVPRVYEKIRQGTESKSTGLKKKIFHWAQGVGKSHSKEIMAGKQPSSPLWKLADKLVYSKLREAFGGNARLFVSGGAPLGMDSSVWFLDLGIRVFEGYGLTETSPVLSRNTFDGYRIGTVGGIIPNIELRIADDGEIEVKGTSVFAGYWRREEETKKEFTADGWFKTGDIGKVEDGYLSITDRKKELLKTSGGKYIAPQPIEGKLKADGLVSNAAVVGDMKKYASVIISPDIAALVRWADQNGVPAGERDALVKNPKVQKQYESIVKKVNAGLEQHETLKRVLVVPEEWNIDSGELTPSMKLKRRVILEKYKDEIAALYRE
ncbi:AMP-binding protein [Granulicella sp. 5B5]|uniref:AMP-dependent synthetase/ligase n=1 Tax=Granulicella sp. 5B5 TaxID=1617967 RepID=UPI0015F6C573|nr:long-chain fatty acid--CoA ligase [Granulicella sp. 5B5]QMV17556.1 AMP-binding protein [Granulicella sp. 5B5]